MSDNWSGYLSTHLCLSFACFNTKSPPHVGGLRMQIEEIARDGLSQLLEHVYAPWASFSWT